MHSVMTAILFSILFVASQQGLAGTLTLSQAESLLERALLGVARAETFQEKRKVLMKLESDLLGSVALGTDKEIYEISQLLSALEVVGLDTLSPRNCSGALRRIHLGWDPQRVIPRLSGMVEAVNDILLHLCLLEGWDEC